MKETFTFHIHTMGCKVNFAESSQIRRWLQQFGWRESSAEDAEWIFIHSCAVTEEAEKECYYWIRRFRRQNPQARIVVSGCVASLRGRYLLERGADLVFRGYPDPASLEKTLQSRVAEDLSCTGIALTENLNPPSVVEREDSYRFVPAWSSRERTRVFFKIQDGCDYRCTFCTIPDARGPSRSIPLRRLVRLVEETARRLQPAEIVFTGINLGDVGKVQGRREYRLVDFLQEIERRLEDLDFLRFRISSVEPNLIQKELLEYIRYSRKLNPHFHVPLQSGSPRILKRMRRRYTVEQYCEKVWALQEARSDVAIGVDVIAGFPGETEEDFARTYRLLEALPIAYIHPFPYSERTGTPAVTYPDSVPVSERRRRVRILHQLSDKKREQFIKKFLGATRWGLVEASYSRTSRSQEGWTDNYIRFRFVSGNRSSEEDHPRWIRVRLVRLSPFRKETRTPARIVVEAEPVRVETKSEEV